MSAFVTVLRSKGKIPQCKTLLPGGTTAAHGADAKNWYHSHLPIGDVHHLQQVLEWARGQQTACFVLGKVKPSFEGANWIARKSLGADASFDDAPNGLLCLDVDGVAWNGDIDQYVQGAFPDLAGCSYVVQYSGSHGHSEAHLLKCHLWFLLAEPLQAPQRRELLKHLKVDPAAAKCVQPLYVADPVLSEGVADPLNGQPRVQLIKHELDVVPADRIAAYTIVAPRVAATGLIDDVPITAEHRKIVHHLNADMGREDWLAVLMGLHDLNSGEDGLQLAIEWSKTATKSDYLEDTEADVVARWESFGKGRGTTWLSVAHMAGEAGLDLSKTAREGKQQAALDALQVAPAIVPPVGASDTPLPAGVMTNTELHNAEPNLVEKWTDHLMTPGVDPYADENIEALATLDDRKIASLCTKLKESGSKIALTEYKKLIKQQRRADGADDEKTILEIADQIFAIGECFINQKDECYFEFTDPHGIYRAMRVDGSEFKTWFYSQYSNMTGLLLGGDNFKSIVLRQMGNMMLTAPKYVTHIRVATGPNGEHYIDLCNARGEVVQIDSGGYRVVTNPPVRFIRTQPMRELPTPLQVADASGINLLRKHINSDTENDFRLVVGFVLQGLIESPKYPILQINGPQGSGKTEATKRIRDLVNPTIIGESVMPEKPDDLITVLSSGHLTCFGNQRYIEQKISDLLCIASTGGTMSKRKLYHDGDVHYLTVSTPIVINGIAPVGKESDLMDRTISANLKTIDSGSRLTDMQIISEFEADRQAIFSAICYALFAGRYYAGQRNLSENVRMADFCQMVTNCEPALWNDDVPFLQVVKATQAERFMENLMDDEIGGTIFTILRDGRASGDIQQDGGLIVRKGRIEGTPSELFTFIKTEHQLLNGAELKYVDNAIKLGRKLGGNLKILFKHAGIGCDKVPIAGKGIYKYILYM